MQLTLTPQELEDIRFALVLIMKQLDQGNSADKILADRLEAIEAKLIDLNNTQ